MLFAVFLHALAADFDEDQLPDEWEAQYGFSTNGFSYANLAGWWQLNQTNGDFATDRSIHNLPLELRDDARWTNGLFGGAIRFDGNADHLRAVAAAAYNFTNFTFSAWVKHDVGVGQKRVIARWLNDSNDGWELHAMNDGGRVRARFNTIAQNQQYFGPNLGASNFVRDGQWHHVAMTFGMSNGVARVYVDGQLEIQATINGTFVPVVDRFWIGRGWETAWKGSMDEIRVYNRVLSAEEIPLLPNTYADADADGLSNLQEYQAGTNPLVLDTDGDGQSDGVDASPLDYYNGGLPVLSVESGNNQAAPAGEFLPAPLVVKVAASGGQPLVNAPVTFAVEQGGGQLSTSTDPGAPLQSSVEVRSGTGGLAQIYYKQPAVPSGPSSISATAISGTSVVQVLFAAQVSKAETPVIQPAGGTFTFQQTVTLTCATPGVAIHYTFNGDDPGTGDPFVSSGETILIGRSMILKAKAFKAGMDASDTAMSEFTITGMVAAGGDFTLALRTDRTASAWGRNAHGQLGLGDRSMRNEPASVGVLSGLRQISGGTEHTVALKQDGTVWAWGDNQFGQLGIGSKTSRTAPVQVPGLLSVAAVSAGGSHSVALKSDGTVWAWGANSAGQLGDGSSASSSVPTQVSGLSGVIMIAAGDSHCVALKVDGTVWTWGQNRWGQLGNGLTTDSAAPVQVGGIGNVIAIASGRKHVIALEDDGTLWAWGANGFGQLGDGSRQSSTVPVQVAGIDSILMLAAGWDHSVVLRSDGTVWAWGANGSGQLGDGTATHNPNPSQVGGLTSVTAIACGSDHSVASKVDGTVWTWGENGYGQLGNGGTSNQSAPSAVPGFGLGTP